MQPQRPTPAAAGADEERPAAAVGKTDEASPAGKATLAVVASGWMRPSARMRETLTQGRSSITVRMQRINAGKGPRKTALLDFDFMLI